MTSAPIGILGAGAIGSYVGLRLAAGGAQVVLVGRPWLVERAGALRAVPLSERSSSRPSAAASPEPARSGRVTITDDPAALGPCRVVLLTVKSRDTSQAAALIARHAGPEVTVVSLQNGLRNPGRLREAGLQHVVAGVVGFNVFWEGDDSGGEAAAQGEWRLVQATSGALAWGERDLPGAHARALGEVAAAWQRTGESFEAPADIEALARGKLLLNLNNGVCAVAGVGIAESVRARPLRRVFARCLREGVAVFRAQGLPVARVGLLAPGLIARLLPLPDAIVLRVAPGLVDIDPRARSSTLQDLEAGKPGEIDDLNGEILRLGAAVGVPTPANAWIVEQLARLEEAGAARHHPSAAQMDAATARAPQS